MSEFEVTNVKMLTGFKTDLFGHLANEQTYELPSQDAEGLIRNGRAVEISHDPNVSLERLVKTGSLKALRKLKAVKKKKEILIETNSKTEIAKEIGKDSLTQYDPAIEKLETIIQASKQPRKARRGRPGKNG